jgi:hypothetical protein
LSWPVGANNHARRPLHWLSLVGSAYRLAFRRMRREAGSDDGIANAAETPVRSCITWASPRNGSTQPRSAAVLHKRIYRGGDTSPPLHCGGLFCGHCEVLVFVRVPALNVLSPTVLKRSTHSGGNFCLLSSRIDSQSRLDAPYATWHTGGVHTCHRNTPQKYPGMCGGPHALRHHPMPHPGNNLLRWRFGLSVDTPQH